MTTSATKALGQRGEQLAADYLKRRGYAIVTVNWRCKHGEIDIIARKGDTLVFVEVRTRRSDTSEMAFESIQPRKRDKLSKLANLYIALHDSEEIDWRVDVIAIGIPRTGQPIIDHAEDALDW